MGVFPGDLEEEVVGEAVRPAAPIRQVAFNPVDLLALKEMHPDVAHEIVPVQSLALRHDVLHILGLDRIEGAAAHIARIEEHLHKHRSLLAVREPEAAVGVLDVGFEGPGGVDRVQLGEAGEEDVAAAIAPDVEPLVGSPIPSTTMWS